MSVGSGSAGEGRLCVFESQDCRCGAQALSGAGLGSVRSRPRRCPWVRGVSVGPSGWRGSVAWAVCGLSDPATPDSPDVPHPSGSEMLRKSGSAKAPLKCNFYFSH